MQMHYDNLILILNSNTEDRHYEDRLSVSTEY
jgi:hypothetical protein